MRQLSLFKGKRQRGVKPPAPLEFADHCFLADVCRRWLSHGWKFTHLPFGERRDKATAMRLHRMGVTPGWPDFLFVGRDRAVFFLELKRRGGGRLSDEQVDVHAHLAVCGFQYLCTNDVKVAVDTLKALGILQSTVQVQ